MSRQSVGAGPQVVLGITRDERPDERPREEPSNEPSLELVVEAERLELVRERSLEIVRESLELVRESLASETVALPAEPEPEVRPEPVALAGEESITTPPEVHVAALQTPDEISIPPAGDLAIELESEPFFSEGDLGRASADDSEEWEVASSAKAKHKASPHVVERRARFARYVKWAVAGAAVVCLAAVVRTGLTSRASSVALAPKAAAVTAIRAPEPQTAPSEATPEEPKAAEPAVKIAVAAVAASADPPKPEDVKPASAEEPKAQAEPAAPSAADPAAALEAKKLARRALERGKLADAIAEGERSVALDPTDGEAWLVLGAAYQEKGKRSEARRCYAACLSEGKRGPRGECRAMLR